MRTTADCVVGMNCARGVVIGLAVVLLSTAGLTYAQDEGSPGATAKVPADADATALFTDFLHYARMGRFTAADAYAGALLALPDLDPIEVLEAASKDPQSVRTLTIIIENSSIAESAKQVLDLIEKGEHERRKDAERIVRNIEQLGGDPQQEHFARVHLAQSGEYAVPLMIQTLLDPAKKKLWPRVIQALPAIGKPAVGPLVMALRVDNDDTRLHVVHALGEIGYTQATPYLVKLATDPDTTDEAKAAATRAIARIESLSGRTVEGTAEDLFFALAEKYYNENASVRADPRLDVANVWYWDQAAQVLNRVVVSERIFGAVMAMRCCEEAVLLKADHANAIALWLAANTRREARLGMNIESGDPEEKGDEDATRVEDFPRALYFTQAAGPYYAHRMLDRAVAEADAPVALGAIEALRLTAGETSLVGTEDYKQPLVKALRFPDLVVRIRAALALGAALPRTNFADAEFVVPVLSAALMQTGSEFVLVVEPDESRRNRLVGAIRKAGHEVIGEANFYEGLHRVRNEVPALSAVIVSAAVVEPDIASALAKLRSEYMFSKTPVVILESAGQSLTAEELAQGDLHTESIVADASYEDIEAALDLIREGSGQQQLDAELALSMSLESAATLRAIAVDGRTVYDFGIAEPALIGALSAEDEGLRRTVASVLALAYTPTAQRSIAHVAMDAANTESLRVAVFGSLAESAKGNGNLLEQHQIDELVRIAREDENLTIRTAASKALGAINLTTSQASDIVRSYYGG